MKSAQVWLDKIQKIAGLVRNRSSLARALVTGRQLPLAAMDDDWPVTKRQMLSAHQKLTADLQVLIRRLDAVSGRVGASEVRQIRVVRKKPAGRAVQVDAAMPTKLSE